MDKSLASNLICVGMIVIGYTIAPAAIRDHVLMMGFFGFSGAVTNWLAVHMLFERVPGLYGSGIIPLKFESFKDAIRNMIMNQFFTEENIKKFVQHNEGLHFDVPKLVGQLDFNPVFDGFVDVVLKSKFGSMLGMFGGPKALESMREPMMEKLQTSIVDMTRNPEFMNGLTHNVEDDMFQMWQEKIGGMVDHRLNELTPQMVKEIVQEMIRSHLGWLVVWGAVFGSVIGLVSSLVGIQ